LALPAFGQTNSGELRLKVTDPAGLAVGVTVEIVSTANQYRTTFIADDSGVVDVKRIPFGVYRIAIHQQGFAEVSQSIEISSVLPTDHTITLAVSTITETVTVTDAATLIDPEQAGAISQIGSEAIQNRPSSLPGRSLQDLVNSQPGWLYEGNAVLHPRGSEYQTQFVVDGIPLTDNRSPGFGPEIEADDIQSVSIYTAGIPAEYGRKMGGIVEVNTIENAQSGFHGKVVLSGGSFDTAASFGEVQDVWGKNTLSASASGSMTQHYLNPVVPENYTNASTTGDFSIHYDRDFTPKDRFTLIVRHELSRYDIPNEQLQQAAGQLQTGDNFETMGIASYRHIFSENVVADFRGMVRNDQNDLYSNPASTPIIAFQNNWFREGYFKGLVAVHHGRHEWKAGIESDATSLHENFNYTISDPTQFDAGTPPAFSFSGNGLDLEQSAFVQDMIHAGKWSVSAGIRWDHYQLLLNKNAMSPRLSVSRYFSGADLVVHASYDRVFQTPSSENILLSNSTSVVSLNPNFLRLPVQPSNGNYYEAGFTKSFFGNFRLDANVYRRDVSNFADDDQLLNTGVSYPIAFDKGIVYGAEAKLDMPHWGNLSGFVSYSYMVGSAWFPVTGGLFLGDNAVSASTQLSGHMPETQDQRNTARAQFRYQLFPRMWLATGAQYGTGLPFDFAGTYSDALAQYGQQMVNRVNFNRGRIDPALLIDASVGVDVYKSERLKMRFQADGENLTNVLDVIDFGGLFSGNAIGPSRSFGLRLTTQF